MRASLAFLAMGAIALAGFSATGEVRAASESDDLSTREASRSTGRSTGPRAQVSGNAQEMHVGVQVSLDDGADGGDENFLYLKGDFESGAETPLQDPTNRPARSLDFAEGIGTLGTFTPRYGAVRLGFGKGANREAGKSDFDVALTSQFVIGARPAFDPLNVELSPLESDDRTVNLGFSMGYAGFNIGARYLYGDDAINYGYRGYDVGVGYEGGKWGTALGFSDISPDLGDVGMDLLGTRSLYTVRLGAFYQISPGLTLGGRFQFHDYRLFDSTDSQNQGEFFLNTNVNF